MSTTQIVVTIVVVVLVVAAVAFAWSAMRRRALRDRFGPEYDRVVAETENPRAAERELRERERRHAELTLVELSPESRQQYAVAWEELQAQFVDDPARAVGQADALVTRLVAERGYPTENYDDQLAHLSVEHARTLGHYRDAHDIHLRNERGLRYLVTAPGDRLPVQDRQEQAGAWAAAGRPGCGVGAAAASRAGSAHRHAATGRRASGGRGWRRRSPASGGRHQAHVRRSAIANRPPAPRTAGPRWVGIPDPRPGTHPHLVG